VKIRISFDINIGYEIPPDDRGTVDHAVCGILDDALSVAMDTDEFMKEYNVSWTEVS